VRIVGSAAMSPNDLDRSRGCLLGGAVGDALGAPVEFMSIAEIRIAFGPTGIQEFAPAYGRIGAVTDDTQMTLFTAEGLIRAIARYNGRGICHPPGVIHHALLRWLHTQGERSPATRDLGEKWPDGWLIGRNELFARRAPGMTCLEALQASPRFGSEADNDSKGCGALMRIAPIGLAVVGERVYAMACESARSTHGHWDSTCSSGFFALLISQLKLGASLVVAMADAKQEFEAGNVSEPVLRAIEAAESLASSDAPSTPEVVERLGAGWVAEEALAISLFCALRASTFEYGVRLAVNHGGDSDSTGSLTGQILGTLRGAASIPERWLKALELRDIIEQLAQDLVDSAGWSSEDAGDSRYPGW